MLIQGKAEHIKRVKISAPKDGVHRAGKDGFVKGVHGIRLGDKLIPKGMNCMYIRKDEETGYKVFYSLKWFCVVKEKQIKLEVHNLKALYKLGVSPKPGKLTKVKLDMTYMGKKIKCSAPALEVQHVHYPEDAWAEYVMGKPYNWGAVDDCLHSPEGYKVFVRAAKRAVKELNIKFGGSFKLGDLVYCMKMKRWYLVDAS